MWTPFLKSSVLILIICWPFWCPFFNFMWTLILYDIQPDTDIQALVLLSPHILPQAHPRHLLCRQGIVMICNIYALSGRGLWKGLTQLDSWFLIPIPIPTSAHTLHLSQCCCKILRKPNSEVRVDIFTEYFQHWILVLPVAPLATISFQWLNLLVKVISHKMYVMFGKSDSY